MRVREESESVAICSPFYSSPEAANVFLQNVCFWHLASFAWSQMFLLTLVKTVPFQLFLLPSNVLFDQASFVPFHLLSHGGKGESFKCSFSTQAVCTFSPLPVGRGGILDVPFKPRQIVSFHLCLRERGGGIFTDFPCGDYIMSWFTLSIFYIIFSSFSLILSCERA